MIKRGMLDDELLSIDVHKALAGVARGWPNHVDTLCCGTLGSIEFLCEAAAALGQDDLRTISKQKMAEVLADAALTGDYRWDVGNRQFNVGLFRGLAGVGYTLLRLVDVTLPNVLVWE
jgi:lantibiotic modifying enzyme